MPIETFKLGNSEYKRLRNYEILTLEDVKLDKRLYPVKVKKSIGLTVRGAKVYDNQIEFYRTQSDDGSEPSFDTDILLYESPVTGTIKYFRIPDDEIILQEDFYLFLSFISFRKSSPAIGLTVKQAKKLFPLFEFYRIQPPSPKLKLDFGPILTKDILK